ncbi:alanine dehydrogenase/PNT domain protein [Teladorsagia circumcincta]|uniref:Alanine dehydrogenase/PNT domain protein n=1 Tax=Teladorsagia circumcincta TaxID=45464 RepID=A0A2G9U5S9_TELCI|nr:alanine dehydrogenase/PNT domain protein [Teladorsagia circumcincta]
MDYSYASAKTVADLRKIKGENGSAFALALESMVYQNDSTDACLYYDVPDHLQADVWKKVKDALNSREIFPMFSDKVVKERKAMESMLLHNIASCSRISLRSCQKYVGRGKPTLGIRRETINAWERRAPLAPTHVKKLTRAGDYISAGAIVREDLSDAQLIISVKQVPIDQLIANKTYAFFSHTIKAQQDNMEMLDTILQRKIRLIDYEKIVNNKGKRLVMFGKWAGNAGFIDILHGLGLRLLALGHHTPFLHVGLAHNYSDSHSAINALRDIGYEIALDKMPRSLGPLVFVFTGSGNVSQGAQELFQHLPHEFVDVATLPKVAQKGRTPFDKAEFEEHPERYISKFATEYDMPGCPTLPHRLVAICDISADPGGSIEFMTECTTIDKPFMIYDADFHTSSDSFDSPSGCLVCSIDNMPAQMPLEATSQFGDLLYPYIFDMLNCATDQPFDRLSCREEVKGAIITTDGKLAPNYEYIADLRQAKGVTSSHKSRVMGSDEKKVLLLGAGMVSGPFADFYSKQPKVHVTVATESREDGHRLMKSDNITSLVVDVSREHDVLDQLVRAKDAGVTIMNESGLDPGIDHMLAMECFDEIREHGGKITSFVSFCGGLPAPEASDNPLRYKFSWSPKGVLTALLNPAKYLQNGKVVDIPSGKVIDHLYPIDFMPGFNLIGYGNRDSTKYADIYGLGSECKTLIRGTLRYKVPFQK